MITQEGKVLGYLEEHKEASVRELFIALDINSPTKRISNLRKLGFDIQERWEKNESTGTRFKIYRLEGVDHGQAQVCS